MTDSLPDREHWLNGWPRLGIDVLIGTGVHCAGCGKCRGITTVAIPDDYVFPKIDPAWPFNEAKCPLCFLVEMGPKEIREKTIDERLHEFKAAKQRNV